MNSHRGIALISVLLFMQVWVALGLLALTTIWLSIQANHHFWFKNQLLVKTNNDVLPDIQEMINKGAIQCQKEALPTDELTKKSLKWWKMNSYVGKIRSIRYYYIVEALGIDPCGFIKTSPQQALASYFRISMVFQDLAGMILQSTVALPGQTFMAQAECGGLAHPVMPGKQAQRIVERE